MADFKLAVAIVLRCLSRCGCLEWWDERLANRAAEQALRAWLLAYEPGI
jgi:hypothetical protein